MASSCGSSYATNEETTNFARICRIVVDVLRDVLWQVLINEIPPTDLPNKVQTNQRKLGKLDVKINTWLCGIYPLSLDIPIAEKFDISSLYTLIRNLCSQVPTPSTQWGKPPPPGGTNLGDDIERVREFRNSLYGHATHAKIDTADFNNLCTDIKNVVSRFDMYFSSSCKAKKCDFNSEIDKIATCSMDKTLEDAYIEKMKEIAILSDDMGDVKQQIGDVKQQVSDVEKQVGDVKQEVVSVKQQVGNVEKQVGDVKQHLEILQNEAGVKLEVVNVNRQVVDVKQEVVNVNRQVGDVKQEVVNVNTQVGDVKQDVVNVNRQVVDVKQEVVNVNQQVVDVKLEVGDVKQEVVSVKQQVGNVDKQVVDVKQHLEILQNEAGVKLEVVNVKQEVVNVNQQVVDVKQEVVNVNRQVGDVTQEVVSVKQQVGNVEKQVDYVKQHLEILRTDVQKGCMENAKKEDIEDLRKYLSKTEADIDEIKETLKRRPDVMEKGKIEELQTKQFALASDESNKAINLDMMPSPPFQVGQQTPNVKIEVSPVVEGNNDPEADKQEPVIPEEIMRMDERSIQMFKEALRDRTVNVYNIRVMVVGQFDVGKTTLCKRLLGDEVNIDERKSTEGIDVHIHRSRVSLATGEWLKQDKDAEQADRAQLYCKLLNDQGQGLDIDDEPAGYREPMHQTDADIDVKEDDPEQVLSINLRKDRKGIKSSTSKGSYTNHSSDEDNKSLKTRSKVKPGNKEKTFSNISKEDLSRKLEESLRNAGISDNEDAVKNILQFLNENSDKLVRSREEYAPLAMWDFAGQFVYYTTHQTFLTHRAVYILVIDLTQQATDYVEDDDCFLDITGKKICQVNDLVEHWLNSIHSCALSTDSDSPPVILVGTHMDKIEQDIQEEKSENIFRQIRSHFLRGSPARCHLANKDFAIDNTFKDPKIKDLQKKIVELASKQPHWGESIPGRWLPLEERLMSIKAKGVKVILYRFLEKMNQEGDVKIESKEELDLFLKFQHDIGNILYFGTEELREWIVLEPQWLIKAMKSLITAEMFILRDHPQIEEVWHQFKEEGKLTQELLDIVWSKEKNPDLHDHKELLVQIMEQLNIIARPMLSVDGENKAEDFFLAPCMLCKTARPEEILPAVKPKMESSSVLCFVFMGKFLPTPIFHRLLAVCVAKWPILRKSGKNQIFCGCGVFEISNLYRLTLYFKSYAVFARVTKVASKDCSLDANVCIPVRDFIIYNLSKILGNLSINLKFELFLKCQCPDSAGDCLESIFSVKELKNVAEMACRYHGDYSFESDSLLKYWFQKEVISDILPLDSLSIIKHFMMQ